MKKYLLPNEGNYYKANLHMHTTISDGNMTKEEVKDAYVKAGYQIVAFTDHEVMIPHPELTDERFLALTSYEIAVNDEEPVQNYSFRKTYHMNLYAPENGLRVPPVFREDHIWCNIDKLHEWIPEETFAIHTPMCYDTASINELIRTANEAGYLVSYNHPVWSSQNYADYAGLKGLWGVECYNTGCVIEGYPDTMQPIDDLLRQGEHVFPLATDDAHEIGHCFGGFVMVNAAELKHEAVFESLKKGDFYCSTGPLFTELSMEDGRVHVECSAVRYIFLNTERRHAERICVEGGGLLSGGDFDLRQYAAADAGDRGYFRITLVDKDGNEAHSRAYFKEDWA